MPGDQFGDVIDAHEATADGLVQRNAELYAANEKIREKNTELSVSNNQLRNEINNNRNLRDKALMERDGLQDQVERYEKIIDHFLDNL